MKPLGQARLLVEHELSVVFHRGEEVGVGQLQLFEQRVDVDDEQASGEHAGT